VAAFDVREALCEIGRRVWQRGFVAANDGNFSYRLGEDTVLATPTRLSKGFMQPEDLVVLDMDGTVKSGTRKSTSEIRLHLNAYRRRPDIRSVVHVHPPHATAFACAGVPVPKGVLEEMELYLGEVPLVPYLPSGTWEFGRGLDPWIETHDAFLLANHGAVTFGEDPFDAYYKMEVLDLSCRTLIHARQLGGWNRLSPAAMRGLMEAKARHGLRDPRAGLPDAELASDVVAPARAAGSSAPFTPLAVQGSFPEVTDEPKLSSPPAAPGPTI
jgi:L-fuculose-phosphate aldolase